MATGNTAEDVLSRGEIALSEFRLNGFDITGEDIVAMASPNLAVLNGFVDAADLSTVEVAVRNALNNAQYGDNMEGIRPTSSAPTDNGMGGSAGKTDDAKKKDEAYYRFLYDQLAQRLRDLNGDLAYFGQEIDKRQKEIDDNTVRINDNKTLLAGFKGDIEALKQGKLPERNADGSLRDAAKEKKIAEYEKIYGKIDRDDPAALMRAMQWAQQQLEDQIRLDEERNAQLQREIEEFQKRQRETEEEIKKTAQEQNGAAQKMGTGIFETAGIGNGQKAAEAQQTEYVADNAGLAEDDWDYSPDQSTKTNIALTKSAAATIQDDGMNAENLRGAFGAVRGEQTKLDVIQVADNLLKSKVPTNNFS